MKILILGATGMMGHMACRILGESHEVFGASRSHFSPAHPLAKFLPQQQWIGGIDVHDWNSVIRALGAVRPDVVLNCIGIVKQLDAAHDPLTSIEINSLLPHRLALQCSLVGAKLIHMSTDCVFSGRRGMYTEDDVPDPVDLYGRSKLLGETTEHNALTIRTSIVGRQILGRTGLFEWVLSQQGQRIKGYTRAIYTGLTTMALSRVIAAILEQRPDLEGVWQIASAPISKYDLIVELNQQLVLGITIEREEGFSCDRSLDGTRFERETGINVPSWEAMLIDFANDQPMYQPA